MAVSTSVKTIREAWFQLNGVMCLYKPTQISWKQMRNTLAFNISRDINELEQDAPRKYVKIESLTDGTNVDLPAPASYSVTTIPNLADHELVRGPAILADDLRLQPGNLLGFRTAGVVVVGLNKGNRSLHNLNLSRPTSAYHIKSQFGLATDSHWDDGKVWEKTTFIHISRDKLDRMLASIQASNQKKMFEYCGVDPQSQTAYELASKGLLRPAVNGPPLIYGIKCVHFNPPDFTLEIHCVNENEQYMAALIHDLGLSLKTTAVCQQIRCIRYGCFTVDDALLRKHWSLEYLPDHMSHCHTKLRSLPDIGPQLATYDRLQSSQNPPTKS
nr:EOG090X0AGI [Daphnia magna]